MGCKKPFNKRSDSGKSDLLCNADVPRANDHYKLLLPLPPLQLLRVMLLPTSRPSSKDCMQTKNVPKAARLVVAYL
jgi:hypothetical protein